MDKTSIGNRMKENYENRSKTYLTRRTPVIIRLDGKAFHTFTRGLKKPQDKILFASMCTAASNLVNDIQGAKLAYVQSDEISILLTDYDKLNTDAWFNYSVQKICSVSASMCTMYFNRAFRSKCESSRAGVFFKDVDTTLYWTKFDRAVFDARCFNIPKEEVCNYFIWRQQDATRNAIQSLGQYYFSDKELNKKSCSDIQDMLMTIHGVNFNDELTMFKRGVCVSNDGLDFDIPVFTKEREYIEKFI